MVSDRSYRKFRCSGVKEKKQAPAEACMLRTLDSGCTQSRNVDEKVPQNVLIPFQRAGAPFQWDAFAHKRL